MAEPSGGGGSVWSDVFMFLGIFILFFVVWVAGGGPSRPISFEGPYLHPITGPGGPAEAYGDPNAVPPFSTGISIGGWGGTWISGGSAQPQGSSNLSRLVSFSLDTSGAKETDEDREYLILSASGEVSTAGWRLISQKTSKGALIPSGAEVPQSGRVNVLSPIELSAGDTMIIVSGRSPVGVSFRENKCTGYFEERQDFRPPLSLACPYPFLEYDRFYDDDDDGDQCLSYIRSIPLCETETKVPASVPRSCERFIEDYLTYSGCVAAHEDDADFKSRTWRVFLGARDELWRRDGETILLLDAEGKVISTLSY